jgi:hypothetical protein
MKNKSKKSMNVKQLLCGALTVFMFTVGISKAEAEHKIGVVLEKRTTAFLAAIFIDTNPESGLDIYDSVITIQQISSHRVAILLNRLIQEGSIIEFDDTGYYRDFGGIVRGLNSSSIISIDGRNVYDIFSSMLSPQDIQAVFPYADRP